MSNTNLGSGPGFDLPADPFKARMVAQCEEIKRYRLHVARTENRWMTLEGAAEEWIMRFASAYASLYPCDSPEHF